jgi:UDP-GlcNAc:undecaprenyl-phosphate GlcNAc-1-phosphate transferase
MNLFTAFFFALVISMLLVPPLRRHAVWLGLMDAPDSRKVHVERIPRSGGLAIVIGALLPIAMWFPGDPLLRGLTVGGLIIVLFGYLDDRFDLDFRIKFLGQTLAALAAMQGGLLIDVWPFLGIDPVPNYVAWPVTFGFLLGITNAINFSDGLDGLAGGISLVTLGAIAFIAYASGGQGVTLMAIAIMGGLCGFLRYNNYPALIFMGDAGSQFLGFMTGGLAVVLTQHLDTALNPALVLLLVGFPILDTLSVMFWRMRSGISPFHADRNHFHHRLLDLGFRHYEAVATIYVIQGVMVMAALPVRFESDYVVVGLYLLCAAVVVGFFRLTRVQGWALRRPLEPGESVERRNLWLRRVPWLPEVSARTVEFGVAGMMLLAGVAPISAGVPLALLCLPAGVGLLASLVLSGRWRRVVRRASLYVAGLVTVFVLQAAITEGLVAEAALNGLALLVVGALVIAIRLTRRDRFTTTPLDVLILLFVVVALLVNEGGDPGLRQIDVDEAVARLAVLFYSTELLLSKGNRYVNLLSAVAGVSMLVVGIRAAAGI